MLHNLSSASYHLKSGDRVATIEFTRLSKPTTYKRNQNPVQTLEKQLTKPLISSLSEIASAARTTQEKVSWLSGQLLIFAALIVAILAVPGFFSYSTLVDRLGDHVKKVEILEQELKKHQSELDSSLKNISELKKQLASFQTQNMASETANASSSPLSRKTRRQ